MDRSREKAIYQYHISKSLKDLESQTREYHKKVISILEKNNIPHLDTMMMVIVKNDKTHIYSRYLWSDPEECISLMTSFLESVGVEPVFNEADSVKNNIIWHYDYPAVPHFMLKGLEENGYL